jgi:hypothetical protein
MERMVVTKLGIRLMPCGRSEKVRLSSLALDADIMWRRWAAATPSSAAAVDRNFVGYVV